MALLQFRGKRFPDRLPLVMAIVNRTPDSFYDRGRTYALDAALAAAEQALAQGADIIDIGGVKAGPGQPVDAAEEIARTVDLVAELRRARPQAVISVDTWRAEVAAATLEAGADLINDAWGGVDPEMPAVVARYGAGLVCTHAGGVEPRTRPHRVSYADVTADVVAVTTGLADRAVAAGVPRESLLIDPGHDFAKNTWHSLTVTRELETLTRTGWPVLVSLSNKDFVGETLDRPVAERLTGTLAVTAICAWQGARVFRAHNVAETRDVVDMVAALRGDRPPAVARRGLA
jgi:dihydropteroate synthase